jgi:hypothetical protein
MFRGTELTYVKIYSLNGFCPQLHMEILGVRARMARWGEWIFLLVKKWSLFFLNSRSHCIIGVLGSFWLWLSYIFSLNTFYYFYQWPYEAAALPFKAIPRTSLQSCGYWDDDTTPRKGISFSFYWYFALPDWVYLLLFRVYIFWEFLEAKSWYNIHVNSNCALIICHDM